MPSPPTDDIAARAPALQPDDSGGEKLSGPAAISAAQDRRIRDLESTIKHCEKMLMKQAKAEVRRRRKLPGHKQVDEEEQKALVDRVYYREIARRQEKAGALQKERENPIPAIPHCSPTKLGAGYELSSKLHSYVSDYAQSNVVSRCYDEAVAKRQQRMEDNEKLLSQPVVPIKTLDKDHVAEAANRLCTNEVKERKDKLVALREKYEKDGSRGGIRAPSPPLSKKAREAANDRLYKKAMDDKEAKIATLRSIHSPEPTRKKLSKKQMEDSAQRLFAKS